MGHAFKRLHQNWDSIVNINELTLAYYVICEAFFIAMSGDHDDELAAMDLGMTAVALTRHD